MRELAGRRSVRKRYERHGESRTKLYMVWWSMISRCTHKTPKHKTYLDRGINVCKKWRNSYIAFRDWALSHGYRSGLELDRRNNEGNYSSSNCRFVTHEVNTNNTSRNHKIVIFGEERNIQNWAKDNRCAVSEKTFWSRLFRGWPPVLAFTTKPVPKSQQISYRHLQRVHY
jgi:hypothetical protein